MRILVTNDDGIHAPGLLALTHALAVLGEVVAVAPDRPRSASGHAVTLHKPLRIMPTHLPDGTQCYATNGTPSDCVVLGLFSGLMSGKPELVVSGINQGPNLGEDLTYSGTVSAAMEGTIYGIPSFAISVSSYEASGYEPAACFAAKLARLIAERGLPENTFLNVNVPDLPEQMLAGVAITCQGRRRYQGLLDKRTDPRGKPYYWLGGEVFEVDQDGGTDVEAVAEDKISVTPIHLDLTNHAALETLRGWPWRP